MHKHSSRETRERIINVAIDLYSKNGYTETSIREIAEGAGIQVSSIYNHFKSKEELLDVIFEDYASWFRSNVATEDTIYRFLEKNKGAQVNIKEIYDILFVHFPDEADLRYKKILKIIYYESINNEKFSSFLEYDSIEQYIILLGKLLDGLAEQGNIQPCDTSAISSLVFSVASAYISLAAMNLDVFDRFGGKNSMKDMVYYVLSIVLEGRAN